jgi:hypothetical protein
MKVIIIMEYGCIWRTAGGEAGAGRAKGKDTEL